MRITQYKHLPPLLVQMHTSGSAGERTSFLDADDHHYIEQVRTRGSVNVAGATLSESYKPQRTSMEEYNGSMRGAEARSRNADRSRSVWFNDEMLDYWRNRWEFEDHCDRERRLAYEEEQRMRQRLREAYRKDRATAAGELEREEQAWAAEQEKLAQERQKRLLATMEADAKWEAAKFNNEQKNPDVSGFEEEQEERRQRRYDLPERHYVPIWELEKREQEYKEAHRQEEEEEQKRLEKQRERIRQEEEKARLKLEQLAQERQAASRPKNEAEWAAYHERVRLAKEEVEAQERRHAIDTKRRIEQYAEQQWFAHFGRYPPLRRKITD